ncbi:ParB/RepB/Spo0J family partition protein [Pseudoruegeria sp. SHC-113]|uniref:ParB/RepB/Spo0J family partition protein n=1 Tax=Pseudoruegeria sp. SHC-113 TaxID=2855439 RepID=UPI0021BB6A43|nr:ParB N-terminal domain-containing protein [Pseudoruegeria sp. SHC-113]MCT8159522.1 ParB N-terminal domain-containing protein [Pseudoruegeria sp. SHC-113]
MTKQHPARPARQNVSLRYITTNPGVFQFRHFEVDQHHVDELAKVLDNGNVLDPITIWMDPDKEQMVVVDGHHRLAAYRQAEWRKKVPVVVHQCGIEQAQLMALAENSKARLPLTSEERTDAAWRLVCLGPSIYSRKAIAKATGASERTVANMRSTLRALQELNPDDGLPKHWRQAMATLKDRERREYTEEERELMIEAKTAELDEKIGRDLGFMAGLQVEAACAVVAKRLGRKGLQYLYDEYIHYELGDMIDPYCLMDDDGDVD